MAEEGDDEREADGGFRRRNGHHEKDDDLSVDVAVVTAEGDEGQVHGVQHDLDREQDRDQVAAQEDAGHAEREQYGRDDQVVAERNHCGCSSFRARTTAPTIATRISTDVASNAKAWRWK